MRLTESINTIDQLESISFNGVIYLVNIKTNKPGNHYISGFHSEVQARKYQSLLNGLDFDKSFVITTTTEEVIHHLTVSCIITTIIPVNEYIIQKTDAIYSIRPELTSKDLLVLVNSLLTPKQVEQVETNIYCCTRLEFNPTPNKYLLGSNPRTEYIEATDKREARKKIKAMFPTEKKFSIMYHCHPNMFYSN